MKRIFQILCLAVATLSLSNCTTYVEDTAYVAGRPGYVARAPYHGHNHYRNQSRYTREVRHDRRYHDNDRVHVRDSRRGHYRSNAVNTRVRATVDAPIRIYR